MYFNFLHNKDTTFTPFAAHILLPTASQLISYTFLHEGNESLLGKRTEHNILWHEKKYLPVRFLLM